MLGRFPGDIIWIKVYHSFSVTVVFLLMTFGSFTFTVLIPITITPQTLKVQVHVIAQITSFYAHKSLA